MTKDFIFLLLTDKICNLDEDRVVCEGPACDVYLLLSKILCNTNMFVFKRHYCLSMYAHINVMISVETYIATKGAKMIRYHKIRNNENLSYHDNFSLFRLLYLEISIVQCFAVSSNFLGKADETSYNV